MKKISFEVLVCLALYSPERFRSVLVEATFVVRRERRIVRPFNLRNAEQYF